MQVLAAKFEKTTF